jgi:hypothetical protein
MVAMYACEHSINQRFCAVGVVPWFDVVLLCYCFPSQEGFIQRNSAEHLPARGLVVAGEEVGVNALSRCNS